ncbi:hypothetical protein ACL9RF_12685 [Sphingobacterium sp. Mn56C]|uniref:hypothetical protein n=1 Tax=Sphingobacterium sp. Mn56C TaxID=3395261 RepID=UPI003BC93C0B
MKIKYLLTLILFLTFLNLKAQIFDNTQAHSSIKWQQINTEHLCLIFPQEFAKSAPNLFAQLEYYLQKNSLYSDRKPRKTKIIVQEHNIEQNGFVQLAPRKSELYSTPSGVANNQEWLPNLALHESRHIVQFDNLTGNFKPPILEQLGLTLFALNLPSWYFEGDAVLHETLYSNGGRGRLPSWHMPIRANIQSGLNYDFNKYVHGSFKDIIPSYYSIGYFMNSLMYEKDNQIQDKILKDMRSKIIRPFNFQRSLKKYYGQRASGIFKETMEDLKAKWPIEQEVSLSKSYDFKDKYPTNYWLPQVSNGRIYTLQDSRQHTPRIISFAPNDLKKKEKVLDIGLQIMPYFHLQEQLITWDEYRKDARFAKQTYNVIQVFDLQTGKKKTLTHKSRYYTPIIHPNLQQIACVEVNLHNESSIALLNITNGERMDSIPLPKGIHLQQPQFNTTGDKIIAIGLSEEGSTLLQVDLTTKNTETLLPWLNQQYERPVFHKESIIFKANYNQKDDLFMLQNNAVVQLSNSRFGAFNPTLAGDSIWYNDYTTQGYHIQSMRLESSINKIVSFTPATTLYPKQNDNSEQSMPITDLKNYAIKPYNTLKNAINFHSISLSGSDFESFDNLRPGFFILSNDVLNTTQIKVGYEYDNEIRKNTYSAEVTYQKYFPKFTVGYQNRGQLGKAQINNNKDSLLNFHWRENLITFDMQLPFSIYRGNQVYAFGFNLGTTYQNRYDLSLANLKNFYTELIFPLNYQVYFNRNTRYSRMDLTPRWGQNFSLIYRHVPFDRNQTGSSLAFRSSFYFPGILSNHGIQLRYSIQNKSGRYRYNNDIPLIEGYAFVPVANVKNTLLLDYRLPLLYPDFSLGQLAYFKRIRAVVSAGYLNLEERNYAPQTFGLGVNLDFNIFKYTLPDVSFGAKLTYLNHPQASQKLYPTYGFSYSY